MLNNECGGHRIQRIPPTERKGRVHTSTVTVAVINPEIQRLEIKDEDFKIEWFSGTGAGGQHRNKHQNSCRITHIPTGKVSISQSRSRTNSLDDAKNSLIERLISEDRYEKVKVLTEIRKEQVGSGMRGDKIRTYRFQDDIVKDHNTGKSSSVEKIMKGNFDLLW
jgi:peptide chain release factor 1